MKAQLIVTWFLISLAPVVFSQGQFSFAYSANFNPADFTVYGSPLVSQANIRITEQGDPSGSYLLLDKKIGLGSGFTTQFTYLSENCDTTYGGADGYEFNANNREIDLIFLYRLKIYNDYFSGVALYHRW